MSHPEIVHTIAWFLLVAALGLSVGVLTLPWFLRWFSRYMDRVLDEVNRP